MRETAALLHDHMIGLITLHSSPDPDRWLPFLNILAKSFDEVRAAGGIGRLWAATGQRHLELQEIDYADILRERARPGVALGRHHPRLPEPRFAAR